MADFLTKKERSGPRKPWRVRCTYGKKTDSRRRELSDVTVYFPMDRWFTLTAEQAIEMGRELVAEGHNAKCLERCTLPD